MMIFSQQWRKNVIPYWPAVLTLFSACLTDAEIVANHKKLTKPGQGQQKLGSDARLGAPTSAVSGMEHLDAKSAFKIPGLNEAMAKEKARNSGEYSP